MIIFSNLIDYCLLKIKKSNLILPELFIYLNKELTFLW